MYRPIVLLAHLACAAVARPAPAFSQDGRPAPQPSAAATVAPAAKAAGRRPDPGGTVTLAMRDVSVEDVLPFIVETTGKTVAPGSAPALLSRRFTVINDKPLARVEALDLVLTALRMNGVGVVEYPDRVVLTLSSEMGGVPVPVLGPDEPIEGRYPNGTWLTKVFRVREGDARRIAELLASSAEAGGAMVTADGNSNSVLVRGTIDFCTYAKKVIDAHDHRFVKVRTQTFRLAHTDVSEVAANIDELFGEALEMPQGAGAPELPVELRVTVNATQNSVTVTGAPSVLELIAALVAEWDRERSESKRVFNLEYTDPLKMRDMLRELLDQSGANRPGPARAAGAGAAAAAQGSYRIEAYPATNSLVVISKTREALAFLEHLIADLDVPIFPGLPLVIELKHADAQDVADQINVILAPAGTRVELERRERGIEGMDIPGPAGSGAGTEGTSAGAQAAGTMSLPWQQSRPGEGITPESPLVGKVRVVPIHDQNAVLVLAAPEYREAVRALIVEELDTPGRQVRISATLAEVQWHDVLALGWGLSNSDSILGGAPVDQRLGGTAEFRGRSFTDSSILDVDLSANVVVQALRQQAEVRIVQQPSVFTADNEAASFFEGQDIPVLTQAQTTAQGTVNESVQYQSVGIVLNVRPRITVQGGVDLEINLEISNVVPGQTEFSSPIFDRRETSTHVIVEDGQTVVLSGILRELEGRVERGVPLLKDIPLLGEVFKHRESTTIQTELLMFITPEVMERSDS